MSDKKNRITAGALAFAFFLIHAAALAHAGEHYHIIWSCHLGCLIVGIGLLVRLPWLYAIGFFWLTMGVPLWLLNVLTSHEFMLTSTPQPYWRYHNCCLRTQVFKNTSIRVGRGNRRFGGPWYSHALGNSA